MTLSLRNFEGLVLFVIAAVVLIGCDNKSKNGTETTVDLPVYLNHQKTPSAHWFLSVEDLKKKFRVGRPQKDILADINWRGNFFMSAKHEEKDICAIAYQVFLESSNEEEGEGVYAIFEDGQFKKFVEWQPWQSDDYIEFVDSEGISNRRPRPKKLGDYSRLLRYYESNPISWKDLELKLKSKGQAPRQIDPGLTVAALALKELGLFSSALSEDEITRNAKLRDQFNGSRLNLGMSIQEVETILKSNAIEAGDVQAGTYRIYGSNESTGIGWPIEFCNLIVLYKDGKVNWIFSIDPDSKTPKDLQQLFSDLVVPPEY